MADFVARIPSPKLRLDNLHNVVEKHEEFDEDELHHSTLFNLLWSNGARDESLDAKPVPPHFRAFHSALTASCVFDEIEVGISEQGLELGAYIFDRLYRDIHRVAMNSQES